jgi:hypothetical protein
MCHRRGHGSHLANADDLSLVDMQGCRSDCSPCGGSDTAPVQNFEASKHECGTGYKKVLPMGMHRRSNCLEMQLSTG